MRAISVLLLSHLRLSYRVRISFFFNFIFPILISFVYFQIFAGGAPLAVARMMGPLIALTILTNALILGGIRSAEMRQRDMFRQYHLTPIKAVYLVLSEMLVGYLTFLPVLAAEFAIGRGIYKMPFSGSYLNFFIVCSLGYLTLSAFAVLLSSVVNTAEEANAVTQVLFFACIFLSGITMPLENLSPLLQRIAMFTPPTLMIVPMQGMILSGDGLFQHLPEMAALASCCLTAAAVGILVFRWDKDEKVPRRKRIQASLALVPLLVIGILLNAGASGPHWIPAPVAPVHCNQ